MSEQEEPFEGRRRTAVAGLRKLSITLLCALGCAVWASSATAGIFRGNFDPVAPELEGFIDIDVPAGCASSVTGFNLVHAGLGAGDCGEVDVVGATVTSWTPNVVFGTSTNAVTGLWWNSGTLEAITTGIFGPSTNPGGYFLSFDASLTGDALTGYALTSSVLLYQQVCTCDHHAAPRIVLRGDDSDDDTDDCQLVEVSDPTHVAKQLGFAPVPEPGSLALVLGALGVGGIGLRRRRRA